jgi:hypothetical protein
VLSWLSTSKDRSTGTEDGQATSPVFYRKNKGDNLRVKEVRERVQIPRMSFGHQLFQKNS